VKTHQNLRKHIFLIETFYEDQLELTRMFKIKLILWSNLKWPVDNRFAPFFRLVGSTTKGCLESWGICLSPQKVKFSWKPLGYWPCNRC